MGSEMCIRDRVGTTVSEYESQLYAEALSITVIGSVVILVIGGVVYFGWKMRYKPPIAPPPLPRTQSEESSNQEAEPSQPPSVPQKPDKENGCCLVLIALGLVFGLIYLIGFYFVLK